MTSDNAPWLAEIAAVRIVFVLSSFTSSACRSSSAYIKLNILIATWLSKGLCLWLISYLVQLGSMHVQYVFIVLHCSSDLNDGFTRQKLRFAELLKLPTACLVS